MEFKIRDDIEIKSLSFRTNEIVQYTNKDIARYVSYFLDKINSIADLSKPIGVKLGHLSFVSVCGMLALVKSGRDYAIIYHQNLDLREDIDHLFSHVFYLGPFNDRNEDVINFEIQGAEHTINTDLNFIFHPTQIVYELPENSTSLEVLTTSGEIESSSVNAAMDHYFVEDDYCVFHRPMQHIGVATLCIYPALFKAKTIILCLDKEEWTAEIDSATHIHFGYSMIRDKWPMPKKLRMLTTGGYDFNQEIIAYVTNKSNIENIVDCYGTKNCPPPLAIRHLKISNYPIPFKWINKIIKPHVYNDLLLLTSAIPGLLKCKDNDYLDFRKTQDTAFEVDETTLYLKVIRNIDQKNIISNVRMHHSTFADHSFMQFIKDDTDIDLKLAFYYDNGIFYPNILVNQEELDQCIKYVKDHDIEAVVYVKHNDNN